MKFAVVGGDRRSAILCAMLDAEGHRVQSFALEKARLPGSVLKSGCLQGCLYGADCVILPVPAETGAILNTPLSDNTLRTEELISCLWPHQLLCGGKFSDESCALAARLGIGTEDLMRRCDFVTGNAAITAEGAVSALMEKSQRTIQGSRVLICGWGRIGKHLSRLLAPLGAELTVAARLPEDRAMIRSLGLRAVEYLHLEAEMGGFDFVINTVPARVLSDAMLCMMADEAILVELASAPGGFDRKLAENIGLEVLHLPGLPGSYAPVSAAALIKNTVYKLILEREERL